MNSAKNGVDQVWARNPREGSEREAAGFLGHFQPVDPAEDILDSVGGLRERGAFFDQAGDDTFDERYLCVLESLETPAVELKAEDFGLALEPGLDHLEYAGLAGAPITVDPHGDWSVRSIPQQLDNGGRDRLVVEEINLGLVVSQDHLPSPAA